MAIRRPRRKFFTVGVKRKPLRFYWWWAQRDHEPFKGDTTPPKPAEHLPGIGTWDDTKTWSDAVNWKD